MAGIYQRPVRGHMHEITRRPLRYSAPVRLPTAPATPILPHALRQSAEHNAEFFIEYFALDLADGRDGRCTVGGQHGTLMTAPNSPLFGEDGGSLATAVMAGPISSATSAQHCTRRWQRDDAVPACPPSGSGVRAVSPRRDLWRGLLITEGPRGEAGLIGQFRRRALSWRRYAPFSQGSGHP